MLFRSRANASGTFENNGIYRLSSLFVRRFLFIEIDFYLLNKLRACLKLLEYCLMVLKFIYRKEPTLLQNDHSNEALRSQTF